MMVAGDLRLPAGRRLETSPRVAVEPAKRRRAGGGGVDARAPPPPGRHGRHGPGVEAWVKLLMRFRANLTPTPFGYCSRYAGEITPEFRLCQSRKSSEGDFSSLLSTIHRGRRSQRKANWHTVSEDAHPRAPAAGRLQQSPCTQAVNIFDARARRLDRWRRARTGWADRAVAAVCPARARSDER